MAGNGVKLTSAFLAEVFWRKLAGRDETPSDLPMFTSVLTTPYRLLNSNVLAVLSNNIINKQKLLYNHLLRTVSIIEWLIKISFTAP